MDGHKLLIVEDDADLSEMLTHYFKAQGYEVRAAFMGEDAVEMAIENVPDIVLLDIRLPDISGYDVCRRLRANRHTAHLPVIFLTERRERDDKLVGLELGAVDYITKPFDVQELRLRVRNTLRRIRMEPTVNPVTGMAEGAVVQEKLRQLLTTSEWGLVVASVRGLGKFRDTYGFVAADDAARAISLMLKNALQESAIDDAFVGHLDQLDYVVATSTDNYEALAADCRRRLSSAIQYFYPATDRNDVLGLPESERLHVVTLTVSSQDGDFRTLEELQAELVHLATGLSH